MREYYDRRAEEYDATSWLYTGEERPAAKALGAALAALARARTLDVGCGTGFLTRHLPGEVVCLDFSPSMLAVTARRLPAARLVRGDALGLPFAAAAFERVFSAHLYGRFVATERRRFLDEARRVGAEVVIVDSVVQPGRPVEGWEERPLEDGSRYRIWKRYFTPETLLDEAGPGRIVYADETFVAVCV